MGKSEMNTPQSLTDRDVETILSSDVPADRPDLAELAQLVSGLRDELTVAEPQPSAALTAFFAGGSLSPSAPAPRRTPARSLTAWLAGLGLGAQVALGATAAAALGVGAGMAGVLPPGLQQLFDGVTGRGDAAGEDEQVSEPGSQGEDVRGGSGDGGAQVPDEGPLLGEDEVGWRDRFAPAESDRDGRRHDGSGGTAERDDHPDTRDDDPEDPDEAEEADDGDDGDEPDGADDPDEPDDPGAPGESDDGHDGPGSGSDSGTSDRSGSGSGSGESGSDHTDEVDLDSLPDDVLSDHAVVPNEGAGTDREARDW